MTTLQSDGDLFFIFQVHVYVIIVIIKKAYTSQPSAYVISYF